MSQDRAEKLQAERDKLKTQLWWSAALKGIKDLFINHHEEALDHTYAVEVVNPNTNLLKETAENTRKTSSRLEKLVQREVQQVTGEVSVINKTLPVEITNHPKPTEFPKILDVRVLNPTKIEFPKIPEPLREVKVSNLDEIKIPVPPKPEKLDLSSLEKLLKDVKSSLSGLTDQIGVISKQKPPEIKFPKAEKFPTELSMKEAGSIVEALQGVRDDLGEVYKILEGRDENHTSKVEITNFPPQHIPTPVTNININSLRGFPRSTAVTVTTSPTLLPSTALTQRRSLIVHNNSANTIYIGGQDVTTSNGFPVLANSPSPSIDAGEHMQVYAVAGSSSEVRVFEVSNDAEGN